MYIKKLTPLPSQSAQLIQGRAQNVYKGKLLLHSFIHFLTIISHPYFSDSLMKMRIKRGQTMDECVKISKSNMIPNVLEMTD